MTDTGSASGEDAPDSPFEVLEPKRLSSPLVFNSPHSGSVYPAEFVAAARLSRQALRKSEDAHVDELFAMVGRLGAPLMRAHFPRAFLDVNREPYELDPRMFEGRLPSYANTRSLRVAGGLGTIARIVGESQDIYARRLTVTEGLERIERFYKPYHATLSDLIARARRIFGVAVLVDCHSMPSGAGKDEAKADIVIGDRFGAACAPEISEVIETRMRCLGYRVVRNKPYAGGYITEHYGCPGQGLHAVQIEVRRSLYMNEVTLERIAGFAALQQDLTLLALDLAALAVDLRSRDSLAAE